MRDHRLQTRHQRALRACQWSATWLLALTAMNLACHGTLRSTILYAVPVAIAAWHSTRLGFVFSGLGALCAWVGGAIPSSSVVEPIWVEGLWAFFKLSVVAMGANFVARKRHPASGQ